MHSAWIKGHAGFLGNETADYFSKWAAHALPWHRNNTPFLPLSSVTINKRPVLSTPTSPHTKSLFPRHCHTDLHLSFCADFYAHSSFFSTFTFKWASGNFCMNTYEPHWNLSSYVCPHCSSMHPLDPITFTAECLTMDSVRQEMFQAWPSLFDVMVAVWWEKQDVTDRRNFIRTLVPNSLAHMLLTLPAGKLFAEHRGDVKQALSRRRTPLRDTLHKILNHLSNHPLLLPRPAPLADNP